jgi:prepilin-type N-terminal cleavage/methylation domain-containing protein
MSAVRKLRRRRARGFTLVELLIALVAGLLVALAVVGLSKEATNTFHEETRVASAEMQLRTAIDRLRADLQRTAYMSTANLMTDPKLGPPPAGVASVQNGFTANFANPNHMSLATLAGVRLDTTQNGALGLSTVNGLSPQAIELAGNFTSVESLAVGGGNTGVAAIEDAPVASNSCQGQRVHINVASSPAIWRMMGLSGGTTAGDAGVTDAGGTASYDQAFLNAFAPVNGGVGSIGDASTSAGNWPAFIVRFVDNTGQAQYAALCKDENGGAARWNNGQPYLDIDSRTPITPAASTAQGGGGASGIGGGVGQINPVQIVRWEIVPSTLTDPLGGDSDKYDLTRTYLDAFGTATSSETIAEYAVDLKFAFTVDTTADTTGNYSGSQKTEVVNGMESVAANQSIADFVTVVATARPQHIRSVRVRIVTRAAIPDRTGALSAGTGYVYRYCTSQIDGSANCTPGTTSWARTRTLMTEVALPNQARLWY